MSTKKERPIDQPEYYTRADAFKDWFLKTTKRLLDQENSKALVVHLRDNPERLEWTDQRLYDDWLNPKDTDDSTDYDDSITMNTVQKEAFFTPDGEIPLSPEQQEILKPQSPLERYNASVRAKSEAALAACATQSAGIQARNQTTEDTNTASFSGEAGQPQCVQSVEEIQAKKQPTEQPTEFRLSARTYRLLAKVWDKNPWMNTPRYQEVYEIFGWLEYISKTTSWDLGNPEVLDTLAIAIANPLFENWIKPLLKDYTGTNIKTLNQVIDNHLHSQQSYDTTLDEMLAKEIEPPKWIIEGVIPEYGTTLISGSAGGGKSSLSRYLVWCVANGLPFLGHETTPCPIMVYSLEDPEYITTLGFQTLAKATGYNPDTKAPVSFRLNGTNPAQFVQNLEQRIVNDGVRLIVIDTIFKAQPVRNESDNAEVRAKLAVVRRVALKHKIQIVELAHSNKQGDGTDQDDVSGASAIVADGDLTILIAGKASEPRTIHTGKRRITEKQGACIFKGEQLHFNGDTGEFWLGVPLMTDKQEKALNKARRLGEALTIINDSMPTGVTKTDFRPAIRKALKEGCDSNAADKTLQWGVDLGYFIRGTGENGSKPYQIHPDWVERIEECRATIAELKDDETVED